MTIVQVNGQDIAYRQSEGTGRPVVFVHGNSSSSATWRHLLAGPFGQRYRCLALDLPGHGASPAAPDAAGYSLPGYAAVVTGFLAAVDAPASTTSPA
jgi:pimeloyl-ACP methyl ester carboxylesterase